MKRNLVGKILIPVSKGDIILFHHYGSDELIEATVTRSKDRYVCVNMGKDRLAPLVTAIVNATGKKETFDNAYVAEVIKRGSCKIGQPAENLFRERRKEFRWGFWKTSRNILTGNLCDMAGACLANMPLRLIMPIDPERLKKLYEKDKAGFMGIDNRGNVSVRKKAFRAWVERNAFRICYTVKEHIRIMTEPQIRYEKEYWRDYEAQLEREMNELVWEEA